MIELRTTEANTVQPGLKDLQVVDRDAGEVSGELDLGPLEVVRFAG
jgi:hypothetical protein